MVTRRPAPRAAAPARTATRSAPTRAAAPTSRSAIPSRRAAAPAATPVRASTSGAGALDRARARYDQEEAERAARKDMPREPFRYFVPAGETGECIIVDEEPTFFRQEHALFNSKTQRYDLFVPCIKEHAHCPACEASDKQSYYAMYLTVIDLVGYENRKGEYVEFTKKLLVVKPMQAKKFIRLYERNGRNMRGMRLEMIRSRKEDAVHGDPEILDFVEEDELQTYQTSYEDQDQNVIEVNCAEPFDYEAIYPDLTERQIRALVGGSPAFGSRDDEDRALDRRPAARRGQERTSGGRGRDQGDGWEDNQRQGESRRPAPSRRGSQEVEDDPQPQRRAARRPAPEPEDEQGDEDQGAPWNDDDNPETGTEIPPRPEPVRRPARAAVVPTRTAPARQPVRRAAAPVEDTRDDDGYAEEDRTPPARNATNVAARRASLRRG